MKKNKFNFFFLLQVKTYKIIILLIFTSQVGNGALYSEHTKKQIFVNIMYITKFKLCTAHYRVECTQYLL